MVVGGKKKPYPKVNQKAILRKDFQFYAQDNRTSLTALNSDFHFADRVVQLVNNSMMGKKNSILSFCVTHKNNSQAPT